MASDVQVERAINAAKAATPAPQGPSITGSTRSLTGSTGNAVAATGATADPMLVGITEAMIAAYPELAQVRSLYLAGNYAAALNTLYGTNFYKTTSPTAFTNAQLKANQPGVYQQKLQQEWLPTLRSEVTQLVQQGYTSDTIQLMAQDPKSTNPLAVAFQQRFPANAARLAAGLPVLSPGDYIKTDAAYAQVMASYGLSNNFAQNKDIFTKLLSNDISPTELNSRASTAKAVIENTDPALTQQLQTYYGLTQGDMIAHVLDPSIATPIIEKQISTAAIGTQAARYGVDVNEAYAGQLNALGITQSQASQGFQSVAQQIGGTQALASRYNVYGPAGQIGSQLEAATFGTTGAINAQQEIDRLKMQEISQFSGSSGVGKGSISQLEEGVS